MNTKQAIKESDTNKETVYIYIKERINVVGGDCVRELKFGQKGLKYLDWLTLHGHLTRVKQTITGGRWQYVYDAANPYIKPTYKIEEVNNDTAAQILLKKATTVYRLMDIEPVAVHKSERPKRRVSVSIGSGLTMFDSY